MPRKRRDGITEQLMFLSRETGINFARAMDWFKKYEELLPMFRDLTMPGGMSPELFTAVITLFVTGDAGPARLDFRPSNPFGYWGNVKHGAPVTVFKVAGGKAFDGFYYGMIPDFTRAVVKRMDSITNQAREEYVPFKRLRLKHPTRDLPPDAPKFVRKFYGISA